MGTASPRVAFQNFANFQPRHLRQHEIKNNQSWLFPARFFQSGSAIARRRGGETGFAQIEREKIDYIAFILDNQHCVSGCGFHGSSLLSPKLFQFASEAFCQSPLPRVVRENVRVELLWQCALAPENIQINAISKSSAIFASGPKT